MGYRFMTDADITRMEQLTSAITCENLGYIRIGGIFKDPYGEEVTMAGYVYRIYDRNPSPPERLSNAPFTEKANKGGVRGLVICIGKYADNDFHATPHPVDAATIADPRIVWIATRYTGGVRDAAAQRVALHQEAIHRNYYTKDNQGIRQPALTSAHFFDFILPSCEKAYSSDILEADIKND